MNSEYFCRSMVNNKVFASPDMGLDLIISVGLEYSVCCAFSRFLCVFEKCLYSSNKIYRFIQSCERCLISLFVFPIKSLNDVAKRCIYSI